MTDKEFTTHGYMALSNLGGIEIMLNATEEQVYYRWYGKISQRPCMIRHTSGGRAYFLIAGRRFHLDNFMKA